VAERCAKKEEKGAERHRRRPRRRFEESTRQKARDSNRRRSYEISRGSRGVVRTSRVPVSAGCRTEEAKRVAKRAAKGVGRDDGTWGGWERTRGRPVAN
jgi:hypothetical protein